MKSANVIAILMMLILGTSLNAQKKVIGTLKGIIVELESQTPLEYATISILNQSDGTLLQGDVSDVNGEFSISLFNRNILVEIAYIGLKSKKIENITGFQKEHTFDLGVINLKPGTNQLNEILVLGEKSSLKFELDKKVFNVGKDVISSSTNALDVLDQIPSVNVDPNGKVNIRGSAGITILIDGKPSVLASAQQLQNLLPEKLEKIEVITNPSAKYDAAGIAGIINIIMKKNDDPGVSGSVNIRAGSPHDYAIGLGLSRRKSKINVFGDVSLRHWRRPRTATRDHENMFGTSKQLTSQIRRSLSLELDGGIDYYFNEKNVLTTSLIYEGGRQPHDARIEYIDYSLLGERISSQIRKNDELEYESSLEYLLNFERMYDVKGKKLKAFLKLTNNIEDNESFIDHEFFDRDFSLLVDETFYQRTNVNEKNKSVIIQFDFEQPINDRSKIEMGSKFASRNIGNQFSVKESNNGEWLNLAGLTNHFEYQEQIISAYIIESSKIGNFNYQIGVRGEITDLRTELIDTREVNDRSPFFNIFPSGHISFESSTGHELQLSYSRRIDRPRFFQLNPFFSYTDNRFISVGNPNLIPVFTNSYEIGHIKTWDQISMNTSLYHRKSKNNIENVIDVGEDGINYIQPQNLSSKEISGLELFIEASPTNKIRLNVGFEGRNVKLEGLDMSTTFTNWSANFNSRIRLPKKTNAQLRFFHIGSSKGIQGEIGSRSRLDLSINKQLMDGKARISFSVMDILQSFQYEYEQNSADAKSIVLERPWRRTFSFSCSYRWE